jgi:uncharacterized Zn-finger protein
VVVAVVVHRDVYHQVAVVVHKDAYHQVEEAVAYDHPRIHLAMGGEANPVA